MNFDSIISFLGIHCMELIRDEVYIKICVPTHSKKAEPNNYGHNTKTKQQPKIDLFTVVLFLPMNN